MAKQSGIHQLRGKVGEHSYYRQTGVNAGLVRQINQGMSERVKTDAAYANTRLNNAEFGQAGRIAQVLGMFITPKFRPMVLPFSQSKMAKIVLEAIKLDSAPWGQRNLTQSDEQVAIDALIAVRKNNPDDYGLIISREDDAVVITADEVLFPAKKAAIGATGFDVRLICARPWIGTFDAGTGRYASSWARANVYDDSIIEPGNMSTFDYEYRPIPPTGWPAFSFDFMVLVIMPYRTVNGTKHTLQEYCTYMAFETPEGN